MKSNLLRSAALACLAVGALGLAGEAQASVLLQDSFGFQPLTTAGGTRFDAAGNPTPANVGTGIDGLRAEAPFTAAEVWSTGNIRHVPTWSFDASPPDPFEQYGGVSEPTPGENGGLALVI